MTGPYLVPVFSMGPGRNIGMESRLLINHSCPQSIILDKWYQYFWGAFIDNVSRTPEP